MFCVIVVKVYLYCKILRVYRELPGMASRNGRASEIVEIILRELQFKFHSKYFSLRTSHQV